MPCSDWWGQFECRVSDTVSAALNGVSLILWTRVPPHVLQLSMAGGQIPCQCMETALGVSTVPSHYLIGEDIGEDILLLIIGVM